MKKIDPVFEESNFKIGQKATHGVYAVCGFPMRNFDYPATGRPIRSPHTVFYIGSSKNIKKRVLAKEHVYRRLNNLAKSWCVYTMYFETKQYLKKERELIQKYKPRYNIAI